MKLKKIEITKYRNLENIVIDFEKSKFPDTYSISSENGGGKSTLLQFVFIMLHCFIKKNKKPYLKNMLQIFSNNSEEFTLAKFKIEHKNKLYDLDFSITKSNKENMNFNIYHDIKDTKQQYEISKRKLDGFSEILKLKQETEEATRVTPIMNKNLRMLSKYLYSREEEILFDEVERKGDITTYKKLINLTVDKMNTTKNTIDELEIIQKDLQIKLGTLESKLMLNNLKYITHLKDDKNVVLLETKMPKELLSKLSNSIFLTAPSSQVFLFLSNEEKQEIFSKFNSDYSYYNNIERVKQELNNFSTYDFASTKVILKSFQKASDEDLKEKRKTNQYGTNYDDITNELKDFLDGKEISENEDGNKVIFKSTINQEELAPEDLSHGELKKLSIYIWLKYIVGQNAIVLMDEIDIALHPKWQYQLAKDLTSWSKDSQFLLATHSPQIISSTYYKNIIKLENKKVKRYNQPPLDRDINAIIKEIMGASDFPEDLKKLHMQYSDFIDDGKKDTKEAIDLKKEILEHESANSLFFQEINFRLELMQ